LPVRFLPGVISGRWRPLPPFPALAVPDLTVRRRGSGLISSRRPRVPDFILPADEQVEALTAGLT
jgi:hypothetical protein